jgi:hypothetical protein
MVDYLAMSDWDAIQACGPDASKWADWYCQIAKKYGENPDHGVMQTWFANAMMAMHDHMYPDMAPVRLPDGTCIVPI